MAERAVQLGGQLGRGVGVQRRRARAGEQLPIDELPHEVLGQLAHVVVGRWLPPLDAPGHDLQSTGFMAPARGC
jgi:hypothetical protein